MDKIIDCRPLDLVLETIRLETEMFAYNRIANQLDRRDVRWAHWRRVLKQHAMELCDKRNALLATLQHIVRKGKVQ